MLIKNGYIGIPELPVASRLNGGEANLRRVVTLNWATPNLAERLCGTTGHLTASDQHGIGIAWDEQSIAKCEVKV